MGRGELKIAEAWGFPGRLSGRRGAGAGPWHRELLVLSQMLPVKCGAAT